MAADVGYFVRGLNKSDGDRSTSLVTRDLLGESFSSSSCSEIDHSQELDLDLQVPAGFEKRLDLKSGKLYLQKCNTNRNNSIKRPLKNMEDKNLELKLDSKLNRSYESVCTLDKVKFALERAKNNEQIKKHFLPRRSSNSPSTSSVSTKAEEDDLKTINSKSKIGQGLLTAAGCPNCLMYVMISKENPKCPKCNMMVSITLPATKKPRIDLDLNISI